MNMQLVYYMPGMVLDLCILSNIDKITFFAAKCAKDAVLMQFLHLKKNSLNLSENVLKA